MLSSSLYRKNYLCAIKSNREAGVKLMINESDMFDLSNNTVGLAVATTSTYNVSRLHTFKLKSILT